MKIDKWFHLYGRKDDIVFEEVPSAQRWIPCSERLPDYHDEVLVTSRGEVAIAWLYLDGNWRSNDMPEPMYKDIVAWMHLPEPYKEENK